MRPTLISAVALLTLTGCAREPFWFDDDVDFDFDFLADALTRSVGGIPNDHLESPYVEGASFSVFASTTNRHRFKGWTLASSDEEVFLLSSLSFIDTDGDEKGTLRANAEAVGEGTAELRLIDDQGRERHAAEIEVAIPDRVELHAAGPLFVDNGSVPTLAEEPLVLVGQEATFQTRYFLGDQVMSGRQVLTASSLDGEVEVWTEDTWFSEARDWVHVTPATEGPHDLQLDINGVPVAVATIDAVPPEVIARIEVVGRSEKGAEEGDWLVLLGESFTDADEPIFGVTYDWDVDGEVMNGEGDLLRYEFDPDEKTVGASANGLRAEVTAHVGDAFVDSSNDVGCNTSGVAVPALGLLGAAALLRRRSVKRDAERR